jgi:hypothetical protein
MSRIEKIEAIAYYLFSVIKPVMDSNDSDGPDGMVIFNHTLPPEISKLFIEESFFSAGETELTDNNVDYFLEWQVCHRLKDHFGIHDAEPVGTSRNASAGIYVKWSDELSDIMNSPDSSDE